MKNLLKVIRDRLSLKVIIGGQLGLFAWGISAASAVAIALWGLKTVAIPLLMIKTASWGVWSLGVIRESHIRNRKMNDLNDLNDL